MTQAEPVARQEIMLASIDASVKILLFVYDLIGRDSNFDSLRFVMDAVRPPKTSANFEKDFGLPRYLTFEKHSERPRDPIDFWSGIYD